jgi:hypothetical protein
MKRIRHHRYGGNEEMRLERFAPAKPDAGEIAVRVKAAKSATTAEGRTPTRLCLSDIAQQGSAG